jgi:hypothetical protein
VAEAASKAAVTLVPRDRGQILGFAHGWELVDPGLVQVPQMRAWL